MSQSSYNKAGKPLENEERRGASNDHSGDSQNESQLPFMPTEDFPIAEPGFSGDISAESEDITGIELPDISEVPKSRFFANGQYKKRQVAKSFTDEFIDKKSGSTENDEQSPKVLHTAFPIAINGQLTFVPQSLFDQETEANNNQRAFAQKYAISVNPKPGEPVYGTITMDELTTDAGVARLAAALRQFEPEVLEKLTRKPRSSG